MIPVDKQLHFFSGGFLFAIVTPHSGPVAALGVVAAAAVAKEVYDGFHRDVHTPELLDALATIAGGAAVMAAGALKGVVA